MTTLQTATRVHRIVQHAFMALMQALAAVVAAIDPADEQYEAQKELAEGGALAALAILLDDSSAAVSTAAADALLKLTQHSPAVLNRLGIVSADDPSGWLACPDANA